MTTIERLTRYINAGQKVLLVGPPALAKTSLIEAAAAKAKYKVVTIRLSLAERIDFGGCLIPDTVKGVTVQLPLELIHRLRTCTEPTLFFIDDLGQGPTDVQAGSMSVFDKGALPPHVLVWGATNRPQDKAGVTSLCEPLRSRFDLAFAMPTPTTKEDASGPTYLGTWAESVDGWCDWATAQEFDYRIVAWHRNTRGEHLYQWKPLADPAARVPDFRSWHTVCKLFAAGLTDTDSVAAAIGRGHAAQFLAFAALADQLPSPTQVFMDPANAPVPDEPAAQWLIATQLARCVDPKVVAAFLTYVDRLPRHLTAYAAKDAANKVGHARLAANAAWQKWYLANRELFATA